MSSLKKLISQLPQAMTNPAYGGVFSYPEEIEGVSDYYPTAKHGTQIQETLIKLNELSKKNPEYVESILQKAMMSQSKSTGDENYAGVILLDARDKILKDEEVRHKNDLLSGKVKPNSLDELRFIQQNRSFSSDN